MSSWLWFLLPLSYLIGTFPSAELAAKANGIDIRKTGSGNPGASNVTRALGWRWGAGVMAFDALKGAVATGAGLLSGDRHVAYLCLGAAIIGHMFPIWRGLQGGKGVATAGGGFMVLAPVPTLIGAGVWWVLSRLTGKASVASLAVMVIAPVVFWFVTGSLWEVVASAAIALLVALRHTSNIKRLITRDEPSMSR